MKQELGSVVDKQHEQTSSMPTWTPDHSTYDDGSGDNIETMKIAIDRYMKLKGIYSYGAAWDAVVGKKNQASKSDLERMLTELYDNDCFDGLKFYSGESNSGTKATRAIYWAKGTVVDGILEAFGGAVTRDGFISAISSY